MWFVVRILHSAALTHKSHSYVSSNEGGINCINIVYMAVVMRKEEY
jgi:hypothetical protein